MFKKAQNCTNWHLLNIPTINNKRVCKTPFKKWYIKGYTNKSDNVNINYVKELT